MNRREFNTAITATLTAPLLPVPTAQAAAIAPISPSTYAWAKLIARAQSRTTPAMLARHLRLAPSVAQQLFASLIADGILTGSSAGSVAQAVHPFDYPTTQRASAPLTRMTNHIREKLQTSELDSPLAKPDASCLGCDETLDKDNRDASSDQSIQSSPEQR